MSALSFFMCIACLIAAARADLTGCRMDLLFILDDSKDVTTQTDWVTKIDAWAVLLEQVNAYIGMLSGLDVNVGVMTFSTTATVKFQLQSPTFTLTSSNCQYSGGTGRDAAAAFNLMTTSVFNGQGGDRAGVPNVAVYMPVSVSKSPNNSTLEAAENARKAGISITAIPIANDAKNNDMYAYISEISNITGATGHYWKAYAYPHIAALLDKAVEGACNAARNIVITETKHGLGCLADLTILMDSSGSMRDNNPPGDDNWRIMTEFVTSFISYFNIGLAYYQDRVAAIKFNNEATIQFYLNNYTNNQQAYDGIRGIRIGYGYTNIADALKLMRTEVFQPENGDRPGVPNVGLIITDGKSTVNAERTLPEAQLVRAANIIMLAVGITNDINKEELCNISRTPAYCFTNLTFADLTKTLVNLLVDVTCFGPPTTIAPPPTTTTTNTGVTDINHGSIPTTRNPSIPTDSFSSTPITDGGSTTTSPIGQSTTTNGNPLPNTTTLPPPPDCDKLDITFVLDTSGSIRNERFPVVKQMIADIVAKLPVSPDGIHVGLISYSDNAVLEAKLDVYTTRESFISAVMKVQFVGGRTNIAGGIALLANGTFTGSNGDRPDVQNVALIVTDGMANINQDSTIPWAIKVKRMGVYIMTIAVGNQINMFTLQGISSEPYDKTVYWAKKMSDLPVLGQTIWDNVCRRGMDYCQSAPCQNGATCTSDLGMYWCQCPLGKSGRNCQNDCSGAYDVTFVVDLSGSVDLAYTQAVQYVQRLIEELNIQEDGTHVAVITYHNSTTVQFYLDAYVTKQDVRLAVTYYYRPIGIRMTNTAEALAIMNSNVFTSAHGDRADRENIAVVVTDGRSTINPAQTIPAAEEAKGAGIEIFSVGLLGGPGLAELNGIASAETSAHVFLIKSLSDADMSAAVEPVALALCTP